MPGLVAPRSAFVQRRLRRPSATLVLALHTVLANPPLAPIAGESATLKLDVFARVPGWARRARADRSSEDHRFARRTRDAPHVTWPRSRCASRLRAFAEGTKERLQVHRGCRRELRGADALLAIAAKAQERKTGARGLRSIMEGVLLETMYKIPSEENVSKVVIDAAVISGESEPLLMYENLDQDVPRQAVDE